MAERKLFNKKWLIALAILVLIGIVVTMVFVFLPKDIKKAVNKVYQTEKTMFLQNDEEDRLFEQFTAKLSVTPSYKQEASCAREVAEAVHEIIYFFNQNLVYAQDNNVFQDNYAHIMNGLDKSIASQKKMNTILKEVSDKIETGSISNLRTAWREFRKVYVDYLSGCSEAISSLTIVYSNCLPQGLRHNQFTFNVFDGANAYLSYIIEDFDYMVKNDIKESTEGVSFNGLSKVAKFKDFTANYITNQIPITNYNFSNALQDYVQKIEAFEEIYQSNLAEVIKSITTDFTFEASDKDNQMALETVKKFLNGGALYEAV